MDIACKNMDRICISLLCLYLPYNTVPWLTAFSAGALVSIVMLSTGARDDPAPRIPNSV